MTINVPEQVGAVLQELAQKLGVAAEALWGVILRQQTVSGWLYTSAAVVSLLVLAFALYGFSRYVAGMEDGDKFTDAASTCFFVSLFSLIGVGAFGFFGLRLLLNPAFYALNYILGLLR